LSLPIDVERVDVGRKAVEAATSVEHAAHMERYAFFARAAGRLAANTVAVAHTQNDQAETFLLRLVRGAGPRGLAGMHPRAGIVIRPLIEASRADVNAFLHERGAEFREDATNADVAIVRNRVRHELLPFLEQRFSPGIVDVLAREAIIARDDADFLEAVVAEAAARVVSWNKGEAEIDAQALMAQPPAVARRLIRDVQAVVAGGRFVGFDAVEAVLDAVVSNASGSSMAFDLPGHRVNRRGGKVVFIPGTGRTRPHAARGFSYSLEVPGRVAVPEAACAISAESLAVPPGRSAGTIWPLVGGGSKVVVEASQLTSPLLVRSRRPGDAFRPLGLRGRKKLQDFFVDEKVQRGVRDTVPLVVDSQGRIVWVAGHALAEDFRVTDRTEAVIILRQEPI
jgi:tRNA(Ile)-lysidine synthase